MSEAEYVVNCGYGIGTTGVIYSKSGEPLKFAVDKKGYARVGLMINGKLTTKKVHRLVCEMFKENPYNKPQVNHIDGNKLNNHIDNLEWCTAKENTKHAIDNGLFVFSTKESSVNTNPKKGELNGMSILTNMDILDIRSSFLPRKVTRKILALKYNVSEHCIKDIVNRKSWKHI